MSVWILKVTIVRRNYYIQIITNPLYVSGCVGFSNSFLFYKFIQYPIKTEGHIPQGFLEVKDHVKQIVTDGQTDRWMDNQQPCSGPFTTPLGKFHKEVIKTKGYADDEVNKRLIQQSMTHNPDIIWPGLVLNLFLCPCPSYLQVSLGPI